MKRRLLFLGLGLGLIAAGGVLWHADRATPSTVDIAPAATARVDAAPTALTTPAFASLMPTEVPAGTSLGGPVIKPSPTELLDFDESGGHIRIDPAAIQGLVAGQYVYMRYGEAIVAHRVHRKERRDDHTYVALTGVDPVDGKPNQTYGAFYLYDDGTVSHSVNHDAVAFEAEGRAGEAIQFKNIRGTKAEQDAFIADMREKEAKAAAEGKPLDLY